MQKEQTYTAADTDLSAHLPLESIILYLKSNGFSIKPDDYIEILKVIERFKPATLEEAGNLICPLIVTNDEEQSRFYIVFKKLCEADGIPPPLPRSLWEKILDWRKSLTKKKKRKYLLIGIPVLVAISVIIVILIIPPHTKNQIKAEITTSQIENGSGFQIGDSITFDSYASFLKNPKAIAHAEIEWNLGKDWQYHNRRQIVIVPSQSGTQTVMLRIISGANDVSIDTAFINVCEKFPEVSINSHSPDPLTINKEIQIDATVAPNNFKNISYAWIADEDTVKINSPALEHSFDKAGNHTIYFVIQLNEKGPECSRSFPTSFTVEDPDAKKFVLQTSQIGDAISPPKKIKNWLQDLIILLFLVPLIATMILRWIMRSRKRAVKKIISSVIDPSDTASGDKKPVFEIPLEDRQQQLIASEPAMNDAMRFMLQRTMDESLALNINRTVQNTIRSGGIPELVYSNKLRNNDYLILIDSTVSNSQQLKLFEYLVRIFKTENISIVRFFYQDNFSKFYNEEYPSGFSVKRLAELYKDFTLIIFGTAHHLVYDAYPVMEAERLNELADWENKGILTPVPFKDWGIKEKLIGEQIILLPADAEGQLRLMKAINEKLLNHHDYLSSQKNFYSAEKYDFTEPVDIKSYLDDEDLFQWICSIAIYPKIRWEVLIELGKAVLQSRGCPEKVNYSNLLKLVRITWLQEGYFPEDTRLGLLKQLGVQEEIIARKKLVELFQYADLYFKDSYLFSNEKKVQEVTNKFIIYANDPAKNENYTSSKEQFEALWKQNKIADAPLKEYLDNPQKEHWETPLKNDNGTTVGTGEYLGETGTITKLSKLEKWMGVLSRITGICLLLLIAISQFGNNFAKTGAAKFLGISATDSSRLVPVTVDISQFGYCMDNVNDSTRLSSVKFLVYEDPGSPYKSTSSVSTGNDSTNETSVLSQSFGIPYRALFTSSLKIKMDWVLTESAGKPDMALTIKRRTLNILQQQYIIETRINSFSPKARDLKKQIDVLNEDIKALTLRNGQITDTIHPVNHSLTKDISFTTNKINTVISGCTDSISTGIIIKYNDPLQQTQINNFADILSKNDFKDITISQEAITDSLQVKFYQKNDRSTAESLAKEASNFFREPYRAIFANNSGAASNNRFEIFVHKKTAPEGICTPIPISQLPSSLTEIWKGLNVNQFITIDARNKKIWLSKGDKKVFDTYNIVDVCLPNTGVYKIIGQTNNRYKVFFIKNVQPNQFVLSVCDNFQPSLEMAMKVDESSCNNYHRMNIYNNEPVFPVPADIEKSVYFFVFEQNDQLFPSEYRRLNNTLTEAARKGKRGETASLINTFFTAKNFSGVLEQKQFATTKAKLPSFFGPEQKIGTVLDNSSISQTFDGTPFDRDCFMVGLGIKVPSIIVDTLPSLIKKEWRPLGLEHDCGSLVNGVWVVNPTNTCNDKNKYSTHGPFITLPPGNYVVEWELAEDSIPPKVGFVSQIQISDAGDGGKADPTNAGKILNARDLTLTDFEKPNTFKTFQLSFTVDKSIAFHEFEFRVQQARNVTVKLRKIRLTQK